MKVGWRRVENQLRETGLFGPTKERGALRKMITKEKEGQRDRGRKGGREGAKGGLYRSTADRGMDGQMDGWLYGCSISCPSLSHTHSHR